MDGGIPPRELRRNHSLLGSIDSFHNNRSSPIVYPISAFRNELFRPFRAGRTLAVSRIRRHRFGGLRRFQHLAIELGGLFEHASDAVFLPDVLTSLFSQFASAGRVFEQLDHVLRETLDIAGRNDQAVDLIVNDAEHSAGLGGDHRTSESHGFQHDRTESLLQRGEAEDVHSLQDRKDVVPKAEEDYVIGGAKGSRATSRFFREANNVFGVWSFDENEPRISAGKKRGDKTIWLKKYKTIEDSIRDNYRVLARGSAYAKFRKMRLKTDNPFELVKTLDKYSEIGDKYGEELASVIRYNQFNKYD